MRLKLILSAIFVFGYFLAEYLINLFYSPMAGVATAQQLDDSVTSFGLAKFIRDGDLYRALTILLVLALVLIWVPFRNKNKTKKHEKHS